MGKQREARAHEGRGDEIQYMLNQGQWDVAVVQLDALRRNMPRSVTEARVAEYHGIVHSLQVASRDESIVSFRIAEGELKRKPIAARRGTGRHAGSVTYSERKYCDEYYFKRQVEGLWQYIAQVKSQNQPMKGGVEKQEDYWSMNDGQLEQLAMKINVPPATMTGGGGWYIDRDRIIDALLKRDKALRDEKAQPSHVVHVNGDMYGSSIQQGTSASNATVNFKAIESDVKNLLTNVRSSVGRIQLSATAKSQLSADVNTIEAQLESPHPRASVIVECLHSARTILEGAAGSAIASGILFEIAKLLAHH